MANAKTQDEIRQENVAETVNATEQFFRENKKLLWGIVIAIVVAGLAVLGYSKFIYAPAAAQAQAEAAKAEFYFQNADFETALNGDGFVSGFASICDEYGAKAGKAVYLYAASCCAQLGQWEDALSYVSKYNGKDVILAARAIALEGDCYAALGEMEKAASLFGKAAAKADNMFAAGYLVKQGQAYESLGQIEKAKACYRKVKENYPQSIEAYDIDKYIAR